MLFIKLMLIILLNETFAYITLNNTETVILPARKPTNKKKISLTLKAFGKQIELDLYRNDQTTSSAFKIWKHDGIKGKSEPLQLNTSNFCYYHHNDHISSAVINFCQEYGWEGLIFLKDDTFEIRPLRDDFAPLTLTDNFCVKEETDISFGKLHHIRRSLQLSANSSFYNTSLNNFKLKRHVHHQHTHHHHRHQHLQKLTIELAVFLDEAAYRTFMPILNEDRHKLQNMILAYVNNIQAAFHHPSTSASIDISLILLEIMDRQPLNVPLTNDSIELLNSFCDYAYSRNPLNDNDRLHWDVALYLTGLNIYMLNENQEKDYEKLAISRFDSVCNMHRNDACALVEFGADRDITSGFASSLVAAREIGHILGMNYDSHSRCGRLFDNIMSVHRFNRGQLTWSHCSHSIIDHLWNKKQCLRDRTRPSNITHLAYNHSRYDNLPGREWNAKAQCEIYFHNKDANVVSLLDICQTLQCETPNNQTNFTGPALEGTHCAHGRECQHGECVPMCRAPYIFSNYEEMYSTDNWSDWNADSCKSSCLTRSKGVVVKRRSCTHQNNKTAYCDGLYYDVALCDDSSFCANKPRRTIFFYTEEKCTEFILRATQKNLSSHYKITLQPGFQMPHNPEEPWIACTIYCTKYMQILSHHENVIKRHDYYASGLEIVNLGYDPYFPDGTWCNYENGQNYYCRQHYCLPENYSYNSRDVPMII